jgi:hypothetical protein
VRGPPDNGRGRAPDELPGLKTQTNTATNGPPIIADQGDPRRVGELLGDWLAIRMAEVDDLVDEARSRVEAIPNQKTLWSLVGEIIVLLRALELEVAELRKAARR